MDGLEAVEIAFSRLDLKDRFDSDFFLKTDLQIEERLNALKCPEFREFGDFVASAFYPAATHLYENGDVPFIRCVDCVPYPLITYDQDSSFEKIPMSFAEESKGINFLEKGEIVITKVGSPCYASLIAEYDKVALSRTVMGVKRIRGIIPAYLLIFLRGKYGFRQLLRQRELTIQYQLTLERVKRIRIFSPSSELQRVVEDMVNSFFSARQKSEIEYGQAEQILFCALGPEKWQSTHSQIAIKNISQSFTATGRFDAEYFQPKYDEIMAKLTSVKTAKLGDLVSIRKSIEPGSDAYGDEGLPFIRIADISKHGITPPSIHVSPNVSDNIEELKPKRDTILLSKDGSVGIAYKLEEDYEGITSGALLHLRVTDKNVLPNYLTLALNSITTQMQAERDAGGSIIQHWRPEQIREVVIPILPLEVQQTIAEKVQASFSARRQSQQLLELAKQTVERAIESSEAEALEWLEVQLRQVA